jgi:hypothetical protein
MIVASALKARPLKAGRRRLAAVLLFVVFQYLGELEQAVATHFRQQRIIPIAEFHH